MATEIGALSHLVEAATALANLDGTASKQGKGCEAPATVEHQQHIHRTTAPQPPVEVAAAAMTPIQPAPPAVVASVVPVVAQPAAAIPAIPQRSKREIFPQRLLAVLNEPSLSAVISWLPHGRSFVIIRPDVFTETVMPKYFPPVDSRGSTKYPSFTRKLNRWGFRQATRGPDTGAFHHPLFQRDHPELCVDMVCQRSRSSGNGKNQGKKQTKKAQQQQQQQRILQQPAPQSQPVNIAVAPLTKESIDRILPAPSPMTTHAKAPTAVSLDETRSETSNNTAGSCAVTASAVAPAAAATAPVAVPGVPTVIKQGISTDRSFVDMAVKQRDEMERMRVAQALLYKAFTSAVQEQSQQLQH